MAESTSPDRPRVATLWLDDIQDWGLAGYDPRRGMWVLIEGRAVGDLGPDRVGALAEAIWDGQPPAGLPGVLSSVDDVARVCEAAGVAPRQTAQGPHRGLWEAENVSVSCSPGAVQAIVMAGSDENAVLWSVTVELGGPTCVLWSAIQAARGGEHQ